MSKSCSSSDDRLPSGILRNQPTPVGKAPWRVRLVRSLIPERADTGILSKLARGKNGAMERCIDEYGNMIRQIVRLRVSDPTTAEDLVQEIFTELWKSSASYDPQRGTESAFVATIARRRTIDWLRHRMRQPQMESLPETTDLAEEEASTQGQHIDRESLWRALTPLPRETRTLFQLHFENGLTHQEIADQTGLPLGSVKTRLRRGLQEARGLVAHLHDPQ